MHRRNPSRRVFLGSLAAAVPATGVLGRTNSAADRVRVAVIGVNGRGSELAGAFARADGAEVVAVCDCDDRVVGKGVAAVEKAGAKAPRAEHDFRRVLEDPGVDAVVVATPDHWHGPMTVFACRAGKDVYVEKPACHNLAEGRAMIEAARTHDRVVQLGTQRRSAAHMADAVAHVRSGDIGKVGLARTWIHQKRSPIGHASPGPVPDGLDWALWQGPAPEQPFVPNRVHYNWHWFWHWGTGELGNNGIHGVDVARWGLNVDAPRHVTSGGGKYVFDDDQQVPDTQVVTWEFDDCAMVWEHRMWSKHGMEGGSNFGIAFYGDNGTLIVDEKGWRVEDGDKAGGPGTSDQPRHIANFLDCVRSRQRPNADIETGVLSTRLCLLGNIAHRLGRKLTFDAATWTIPGDADANALLTRDYNPAFDPSKPS
jgi:predicted dehydrogenase